METRLSELLEYENFREITLLHYKPLFHSSCQLSWHLNIWSVRELGICFSLTWYILESSIFFFSSPCVVSWCRIWSTGIFLCVCLDHCDNLLFSSSSGALQGLDLIKAEFSSHQDVVIKSMCKEWLTLISGARFHNFNKGFPRKSLMLYYVYIPLL